MNRALFRRIQGIKGKVPGGILTADDLMLFNLHYSLRLSHHPNKIETPPRLSCEAQKLEESIIVPLRYRVLQGLIGRLHFREKFYLITSSVNFEHLVNPPSRRQGWPTSCRRVGSNHIICGLAD